MNYFDGLKDGHNYRLINSKCCYGRPAWKMRTLNFTAVVYLHSFFLSSSFPFAYS